MFSAEVLEAILAAVVSLLSAIIFSSFSTFWLSSMISPKRHAQVRKNIIERKKLILFS